MKKFSLVFIFSFIFSVNTYAEIIILDCKNLMKDVPQNILYQTITIDTKSKNIDDGFGIGNSPIIEETDKYFKAKHYGPADIIHVDRYTGVIKFILISNVNGKKTYTLFDHYKCEKTEKKF